VGHYMQYHPHAVMRVVEWDAMVQIGQKVWLIAKGTGKYPNWR
jgi:hypothetical protein